MVFPGCRVVFLVIGVLVATEADLNPSLDGFLSLTGDVGYKTGLLVGQVLKQKGLGCHLVFITTGSCTTILSGITR